MSDMAGFVGGATVHGGSLNQFASVQRADLADSRGFVDPVFNYRAGGPDTLGFAASKWNTPRIRRLTLAYNSSIFLYHIGQGVIVAAPTAAVTAGFISFNGGSTWQPYTFAFTDKNLGATNGQGAMIINYGSGSTSTGSLMTWDYGKNWSTISVAGGAFQYGRCFVNDQTIVVVNYASTSVSVSWDTGRTWTSVTAPAASNWRTVNGRRDGVVVAAAASNITGMISTNFGQTWAAHTLPLTPGSFPNMGAANGLLYYYPNPDSGARPLYVGFGSPLQWRLVTFEGGYLPPATTAVGIPAFVDGVYVALEQIANQVWVSVDGMHFKRAGPVMSSDAGFMGTMGSNILVRSNSDALFGILDYA